MIMMDHWPRQGNAILEKHAGHERRYTQPASQQKHLQHSRAIQENLQRVGESAWESFNPV